MWLPLLSPMFILLVAVMLLLLKAEMLLALLAVDTADPQGLAGGS